MESLGKSLREQFARANCDTLSSKSLCREEPSNADAAVSQLDRYRRRLLLTMIAGALMGFNRGAKGHAAGLRTTILVALAASIAMIQANILLPLDGKQPGSFAVMDLMRLPLGILTGVGFLGGGAILKKGGSITGLTTAATLWIATVIGLCFGGGQLGLGAISTAVGMITLWAMEWIDVRIRRDHNAVLVVTAPPGSPTPGLDELLRPRGYRAR
jgi:putative Mg2+ transporter-C (MgtC) family protein